MNLLRGMIVSAIVFAGPGLAAAEVAPVYMLASVPTTGGSGIAVQLAALNPSAADITVGFPTALTGNIDTAEGRRPVALQARDPSSTPQIIPAGRFALRTYTADVSGTADSGPATLEVALPGAGLLRTALAVPAAVTQPDARAVAQTQRPTTNLARARPAAAALRRVFAERIGPHEPIYFVYGPDAPAAKFQFSFKYKLLDFATLGPQRRARTLQFAFTQRSLWDIGGVSSPFYDTSYMPEVMYESLSQQPEQSNRRFTWLGFQAAYKHESNGRDGPQSRSLNILYARSVFAIGRLHGWHLLAIPEVHTYLRAGDDTVDIEDYRGYGKLHLVFGRPDGPSLMVSTWAGKDFDHPTFQFDLTVPVRTKLLNFETYLLVQYFTGYGESLLFFRDKTETIRAGFSLVR